MSKSVFFGMAAGLMLAFAPTVAGAVTVDYTAQGTFDNPGSYTLNGVTVTGSGGGIGFLAFNGIGSFGGPEGSYAVDAGETLSFVFDDGPASQVSYFFNLSADRNNNNVSGDHSVEVFGVGGASLGVFLATLGTTDLTSLVSGALIESFIFTAIDTARFDSIEYFLADVSDVPVPAALPLLLSGLAGLGFASRRRKKAA